MYRIIINTSDEQIEIPIKNEETIKILDKVDYSKLAKMEFHDKYVSCRIKNLVRVTIERDIDHDN